MKIDYIAKMNEIIASKKKNGLVGIKFCILPETKEAARDYQAMARAFCKAEELKARGVLKSTTSPAL